MISSFEKASKVALNHVFWKVFRKFWKSLVPPTKRAVRQKELQYVSGKKQISVPHMLEACSVARAHNIFEGRLIQKSNGFQVEKIKNSYCRTM